MAKSKRKQEIEERKIRRIQVGALEQGRSKSTSSTEELTRFWSEEILALRNNQFATPLQAQTALVEAVVSRIGGSRSERQKAKQFLEDLITTDPSLSKSIAELLKG